MNPQPGYPSRLEWRQADYTLVLDEDGLHITNVTRSLEQPDALKLIELYNGILTRLDNGLLFGAPKPPTREEIQNARPGIHMRYAAKVMARAIDAEIDPADTPF